VDEREARERLAAARVGRLATVSADGAPHVVPFVFVVDVDRDGDTLYWAVDRKPKRSARLRRLDNIRADPRVQVVIDEYDEDWSRLWWVRASGTAEVLAPGPRAERAVALLASKYPQYAAEPPDGPVVGIRITTVAGWEA
jgi:PPOX class probable F420-dependent enzyme